MAKYYGTIGFIETVEDPPDSGVWKEKVVERKYYGDLLANSRRWDSSGELNDNFKINNKISIVSDFYANNNFHIIRYAELLGAKWKITNVEIEYPRLILTLGDIYHGYDNDNS